MWRALPCALAALLLAPLAAAQCRPPPPALLWSYPAEGDTDIPSNVTIWALASVGLSEASLDGSPFVPLDSSFSFQPGSLTPNSTHRVEFHLNPRFGEDTTLELTFSTGAGPAAPDPSAAPGSVSVQRFAKSERSLSAFCSSVLQAGNCFDTGQDTHFVFEPQNSAIAWVLVEDRQFGPGPLLWPAVCGAPDFFSQSSSSPCLILAGIDRTGSLHEGQSVCAPTASAEMAAAEAAASAEPSPTIASSSASESASPGADPRTEIVSAPPAQTHAAAAGGCTLPARRPPNAPFALAVPLALAVLLLRIRSGLFGTGQR